MAAKSSKPRPSYRVHASPKALPSMPRPALPARRAPVFRLLPARCRRGWACARGRPGRGSPRPQSACTRAVCGTLGMQDQARTAGPPLPLPTPCIAPCTAHQPTRRHGGESLSQTIFAGRESRLSGSSRIIDTKKRQTERGWREPAAIIRQEFGNGECRWRARRRSTVPSPLREC